MDTFIEYAKKALRDEITATSIYKQLAMLHKDENIGNRLARIAEMEERHVNFWRGFLQKRGCDISSIKPNRVKILVYIMLFRILGVGLTLRLLEVDEQEAVELYAKILENEELDSSEKEEIKRILEDELVHEQEFAEEESKFEDFLAHIREAVLGMNDGLVEVLSVVSGLAGAYGSSFHVALGGLIVGIAGALSMGIGSLASARAQKQVREGVLRRIRNASLYVAHLFRERIVKYMVEKGFSIQLAQAIADESSKNHNLLSEIIAEEEYGFREETLGDPLKSGLYTGVFYAIGAFIPLLPYLLNLPLHYAIPLSLALAGVALGITGFLIAISANLDVKGKVIEMLFAGLGSAGITFLIGKLASIVLGVSFI